MAKLGKYELLRKLAVGKTSEIFLARVTWARGLGKLVVMKRILRHLAEDPAFGEMFFAEARLAAQLSHPNIAEIIEFGESEGDHFLAMEYVDGLSVRALADAARPDGGIPFVCSARIAAFCCEALGYAHDLEDEATGKPLLLVHRDVSPDNVLVSKAGSVKLVDFGIAKATALVGRTSATGMVKGTLSYMAPEQLRAEPLDRRADIYSLGAMLYEMVAGAKPFNAPSDIMLVHAMLFDEMVPIRARRADVPPELARIIEKALARDSKQRYPHCRAMHDDLEAYLLQSRHPVSALQLAKLVEKYRERPQVPGGAAAIAAPAATLAPGQPGQPAFTGSGTTELRKLLRVEPALKPEVPEPTLTGMEAAPPAAPAPAATAAVVRAADSIRWDLVEEHLDEADFLHGLWEASLRSPSYALAEIADGPERRLLAHLDGLVLGGPRVAEKLLVPSLSSKEPGVAFAAAFALLDGGRPAGFDALIGSFENAPPESRAAIRRAMAVVPSADLGQRLAAMVEQAPHLQVDLLEVLGQLRVDPHMPLDPLVATQKPSTAALALRLGQVFPARLELDTVERARASPAPEVCAAAFETGLVSGAREAMAACEAAVAERGPASGTAALLLGLSGDEVSTTALLQALEDDGLRRDAVYALGFTGRISAADELLRVMDDEAVAPLAAEAFAAITGLKVEKRFAIPARRWSPDEEEDELLEEVDLDLPQPDADEIARWWKGARPKLDPSQRWLRGQPWSAAALLRELEHGPARRREALALDLSIRSRGQLQVAWNGLAARQRQELLEAQRSKGRLQGGSYRELNPPKAGRPSLAPAQALPRAAVRRAMPAPASAVAVTGIGLVTSLGWGAAQVCAALRANLARPGPLDYTVVDSEEASASPAVGHPVEGFEGYEGLALLAKMAGAAVEDLLEAASPSPEDPAWLEKCALLCAVAPARVEDGDLLDEMADQELAEMVSAFLPAPPVAHRTLLLGHTAGLVGIAGAIELLASRRADRVVVVAVDRLTGRDELEWLVAREMLKTPEHATGLAPGQAAVALLMETPAAARRRGAQVLGFVEAVASGKPKKGRPPGRALADAILHAWPARASVGDLYGDLNGETSRAYEWGSAQVFLAPRRSLEGCSLQLPALGLGDTGAASGLVSVAMALRDYARGWARGERSIVWSQSDSGEVAAALVTAPEEESRPGGR